MCRFTNQCLAQLDLWKNRDTNRVGVYRLPKHFGQGIARLHLGRAACGGNFLNWPPVPVKWHLDQIKSTGADALLHEADGAIRQNLQAQATAIVSRYSELGPAPPPVFDLLLRYAVSEDSALHARKYYRTLTEEFAAMHPAFRWRQLLALARVTASEYGAPPRAWRC